nr:hypothetical protein [uncultured Stomatobaculum sp.]
MKRAKLVIVFIFDSMKETSEMMRELRIYPIDLVMQFNEEYEPTKI